MVKWEYKVVRTYGGVVMLTNGQEVGKIANNQPVGEMLYEYLNEVGEEGWIVAMNFREHVIDEFKSIGLDNYLLWGERYDSINWRTFTPENIYKKLEEDITKRLGM